MSRKLSVSVRFMLLLLFVIGFGQGSRPAYSAGQALQAICTDTWRIMPLGDSITRGSSSGETNPKLQASYRRDLYNSLTTSGYSVDFVGSLTNGEDVVPSFDPQHEGHAGWTDLQIFQNIYNYPGGQNWLGSLGSNWPHIILLHIGTNSLDINPGDVEAILNEIDEFENDTGSHITVILARIIDWVPNNPFVHTFNDNVQDMAEARVDDDIVLVDMEDGAGMVYQLQPDGDFIDGLHPYHFGIGYTRMAAVWHDAVVGVFATCNHPPNITSDPGNQDDAENTAISLEFYAIEQDAGQTLSWSATNLPGGLSIDSASGLISGTIDYDAAAGSPYQTVVTVHDSGNPSASDTYSITWKVTNTNRVPNAVADRYDTSEDVQLNMAEPGVLENDSDPDGDPSLAAILESGPSHGTLTLNPSGSFDYTPEENYNGTDSFTYKANDGTADSNVVTVTINIAAVNDAPVADDQAVTTNEDVAVDITLTATDVDGDTLTYSVVDGPLHGVLSGSGANLTYTPDTGFSGTDSFTFKVNDGKVDSTIAEVSITISANNPPEVNDPGDQENVEGEPVTLQIVASDEDPLDTLSFSISGQPPDLMINPNTGIISGELASGSAANSPYSVTVAVTDGHATSEVVFTWTVTVLENPRLFLPMITVSR